MEQVNVGNEGYTGSGVTAVEPGLDVGGQLMEGSDGSDHTVKNLDGNSMVYNLEEPKGSRCSGYLLHDRRTGPREVNGGYGDRLGFGFGFKVG